MAKFTFKKNEIVFDIENKKYYADAGKVAVSLIELGKLETEAANMKSEDDIRTIINKISDIIDDMIGRNGAFAEMCGEREINIFDVCDLIGYMAMEAAAFAKAKMRTATHNE